MAQDATYQTKTYHERGGDRYVMASGGTLAIESGGSILITNSAQMTVSGTINLLSSATLSMISGASWGIAGADIAVDDIRRILASEQGDTTIINISVAAVSLSAQQENLPKNVRFVTIVASDTLISGSFWLTSVSAGREVHLHLVGDISGGFTNASTQVDISCSGCILLGSVGNAISGFEMYTSLASDCGVHLIAVADNTWAIVSEFGDIDG